jgi:hypothetical protein
MITLFHAANGQYELELVFNPPASSNYVLVVEAARGSELFGHWEEPASVIVSS